MTFIRTKRVNGKTYYYRVESYREAGKMRQRVIEYLGKEIPEKYLSEYKKRGPRVSSPKTEIPTRPAPVNPGEARGDRHGRKKARKVLST